MRTMKLPSVLVSSIEYDTSVTVQLVATVASNGDVVPDANSTDSSTLGVVPMQSSLMTALTSVPKLGAATKYSAWSWEPTLPPTTSRDTRVPLSLHAREALYTNRHRFMT